AFAAHHMHFVVCEIDPNPVSGADRSDWATVECLGNHVCDGYSLVIPGHAAIGQHCSINKLEFGHSSGARPDACHDDNGPQELMFGKMIPQMGLAPVRRVFSIAV